MFEKLKLIQHPCRCFKRFIDRINRFQMVEHLLPIPNTLVKHTGWPLNWNFQVLSSKTFSNGSGFRLVFGYPALGGTQWKIKCISFTVLVSSLKKGTREYVVILFLINSFSFLSYPGRGLGWWYYSSLCLKIQVWKPTSCVQRFVCHSGSRGCWDEIQFSL